MNVRHSFPKNIFRAYDIRGKLSYLTTDVVRSIAYGLAQQYKQAEQTQLIIGYDARLTSPAYAHLIEDISRAGFKCYKYWLLLNPDDVLHCTGVWW